MDCATAMKEHDEAKIQGWKEEIDTHLVFLGPFTFKPPLVALIEGHQAGLFSAILTAFNVEAYQMLLPQDSGSDSPSTDDLLRLLIATLAQSNGNTTLATLAANSSGSGSSSGNGNNSTGPYAVAINALWFCSLICSLAAASISILVKQWLNQYASGMASVSPEIARVRQFRYDSLKKWRVEDLMMLLPILLQGAVVLLLLGLILFLSQLKYNAVTYAAAALIVVLLFFLLTRQGARQVYNDQFVAVQYIHLHACGSTPSRLPNRGSKEDATHNSRVSP